MTYHQQRREQAELNRARDYMDERIIDRWDSILTDPDADRTIIKQVVDTAESRGLKRYEDARYERHCLYNYRKLKEGHDG